MVHATVPESGNEHQVDSGQYGSISKANSLENGATDQLDSQTSNIVVKKVDSAPLKSKDWWLLFALCYAQFCLAACVSLQAPFFPKEACMKGASATIYGLVFGVFELVIIISSPIYGKLVAWVPPSFMVSSGIFLSGACSVLFGFINSAPYGTPFIALAFAVRIVEGLGCAAVITASFTIVASEYPERVAKTFSALETSFGLGLIVGPTIGGVLYAAQGFTLPFLAMGIFMLMGSVLSCIVVPETKAQVQKPGDLTKYAMNFGVILDGLSLITSMTFIGFNSATLEPHIRQFDVSPSLIGFIFIITGSIYGITTPFWGWLCDKGIDLNILIIIGYILQCINMVFIGPAPYLPLPEVLWGVVLSLVVGGFGLAAKVVCTFIHALRHSLERGFPDDITTHAMVSALFASCCSIGAFIGPTVGGVMLDTIGYRAGTQILLAMEILVMTMTVVHFACKSKPKTQATTSEPAAKQKGAEKEELDPLLIKVADRYVY